MLHCCSSFLVNIGQTFLKRVRQSEYHKQLIFEMFPLFLKNFSCLEDFNLELKIKFPIAIFALVFAAISSNFV